MSIRLMTRVWDETPSTIGKTTLLVLLCLADHANDDGVCWPSADRLAKRARCSERQVRRIVDDLEKQGYLTIFREKGRSHRFTLTFPNPGHPVQQTPDILTPTPDIQMSDEPSVEPSTRTTTSPSTDVEAPSGDYWTLFEQFWMTYPRKVGKRAAQAAYVRARRRGVMHVDILDGAQRYRDDPNREMKFTAHPTTWLNRDGWHDEPLPARGGRMSANEAVAGTMALAERLRGTPGFSTAAGPWGQIEGAGS